MEDRDFIIIGAPEWELEIGSNIRNMAIEISRHNRVLYVNPPIDRNTIIKNRRNEAFNKRRKELKSGRSNIAEISKNLWLLNVNEIAESINWVPFQNLFLKLNAINVRRFSNGISEAIRELSFSNFIILNDSLMFKGFGLAEYLNPAIYAYYIRDNLTTQPYFKKHGLRLEPKLIASVDLVLANSVYLRDYARSFNKNSFYIGQGYENENFDYKRSYQEPLDMKSIEGPKIGYIGALTSLRLDIELLQKLAERFTDCAIVLIGPEDENFKKSQLHKLTNIHFLGLKKMDELGAYLKYFDVCINPQLLNDLTIGNYPIKIDEYLSMGKPIVATKTEGMAPFNEHVYLAPDHLDFMTYIDLALKENTIAKEEERVEFASQHSWENSIGLLYKSILDYEGK